MICRICGKNIVADDWDISKLVICDECREKGDSSDKSE